MGLGESLVRLALCRTPALLSPRPARRQRRQPHYESNEQQQQHKERQQQTSTASPIRLSAHLVAPTPRQSTSPSASNEKQQHSNSDASSTATSGSQQQQQRQQQQLHRLEIAEQTVARLQQLISAQEVRLSQLEADLLAKDEAAAAAEERIDMLIAERATYSELRGRLEREATASRVAADEQRRMVETLRHDNSVLRGTCARLRAHTHSGNLRVEQLEDALADMESRCAELEDCVDANVEEATRLENEQLVERLQQLEERFDAAVEERATEKTAGLCAANTNLRALCTTLRAECKALTREKDVLAVENDALAMALETSLNINADGSHRVAGDGVARDELLAALGSGSGSPRPCASNEGSKRTGVSFADTVAIRPYSPSGDPVSSLKTEYVDVMASGMTSSHHSPVMALVSQTPSPMPSPPQIAGTTFPSPPVLPVVPLPMAAHIARPRSPPTLPSVTLADAWSPPPPTSPPTRPVYDDEFFFDETASYHSHNHGHSHGRNNSINGNLLSRTDDLSETASNVSLASRTSSRVSSTSSTATAVSSMSAPCCACACGNTSHRTSPTSPLAIPQPALLKSTAAGSALPTMIPQSQQPVYSLEQLDSPTSMVSSAGSPPPLSLAGLSELKRTQLGVLRHVDSLQRLAATQPHLQSVGLPYGMVSRSLRAFSL